MKYFIKFITIISIFASQVIAQQGGVNQPETNPEIIKLTDYLRNYASYEQELPDYVIKEFCNHVNVNPIITNEENYPNDKISFYKVNVAQTFFEKTKSITQKNQIAETMVNYLKKVQAMRNEIGQDLSDSRFQEESPMQQMNNISDSEETEQERVQRYAEENWKNAKVGKIQGLKSIYDYAYRELSELKGFSLEGIPEKLKYIESAEAKKKRELNKAQQDEVESTREIEKTPQPTTKEIAPLTTPNEEKDQDQKQPIPLTKADTTKSVATNNDLNAERKIVSSNSQQQPSQPWLIAIAAGIIFLLCSLVVVWWKKKRSV
jgi:hypothetical protein